VGCRCRIAVGVGMFLLSFFIMDSCVSFLVSRPGVCAVMSGGVFLEVLSISYIIITFSRYSHLVL